MVCKSEKIFRDDENFKCKKRMNIFPNGMELVPCVGLRRKYGKKDVFLLGEMLKYKV